MGMDVSGKNPKINSEPDMYPIRAKWESINWGDRNTEEWKKEQKQYWEEDNGFNKDNPGIYFRNNCWAWRPLWNYCFILDGQELISKDTFDSGHYNDGAGLNSNDAAKLGVKLMASIEDGSCLEYQQAYEHKISQLPVDKCGVCNNNNRGNSKKKDCNRCEGKGTTQSMKSNYPFDVENVRDFARFCIESGGFSIW
jgi:hypothetical protein